MAHKGQPWTPWETMMISEWVGRTFGDVEIRTMVRLGKIQPRTQRVRSTGIAVYSLR